MLVLMDNATAEYTFVTSFFAPDLGSRLVSKEFLSPSGPVNFLSPPLDEAEPSASGLGSITPESAVSMTNHNVQSISMSKEDQNTLNGTWKQIMDPAMDHCQVNTTIDSENIPIAFPFIRRSFSHCSTQYPRIHLSSS
jgi:vacuolar protein sorting-associated protein 52